MNASEHRSSGRRGSQLEEAVIEQDAAEADIIEGDIAIADPEQVEPELIGETPELFPEAEQDGVEESEATETPAPRGDGKRLSLKERLAARRQAEQGEEPEDQEGRWYVLHTYSGYENKVKKTIETRVESLDLGERVYEIIVPTQEEIEIKNGQRQTVLQKVFPAMSWSGCRWTMRPGTRSGIHRVLPVS